MSRWMLPALVLLVGSSAFPAERAGHLLSYGVNNSVVVKEGRKTLLQTQGISPSLSPSGGRVAFFRGGGVYVADLRSRRVAKLTSGDPSTGENSFFPARLSWSPSGSTLAYTRVLPFRLAPSGRALEPVVQPQRGGSGVIWLTTIWLLDVKSKRATQLLGPMGDVRSMNRTGQLEGASVYEPIFSPDGRWLWFLNAGSLYEIPLDRVRAGRGTRPRLVAEIGGLDFESDGASKAGSGAREMAWDPVHKRLCYWIGRFWGTGFSEYGYMTWRVGKWGKPSADWNPFAHKVVSAWPNIEGCAVDCRGLLWVLHITPDHRWMWERCDGRQSLPAGTSRPSFALAVTVHQ